ncbi:MAG: ABC transporter ATP-binding protein [Verrucomicrobiales bacterium]
MVIIPALVGFHALTGYLSAYFMGWVGERVVNDLRVDVVTKLSSLSLDYFNRSRMGDLITRVNGDTGAMARCLGSGLEDLIKEPFTILAILVGMFWVNPTLTVLAGVFMPVAVLPLYILGRKARRAGNGARDASEKQAGLLIEFLSGIRVVKAFGLERQHIERFREQSRLLIHHAMKGIQSREQINPIIEFLAAIGFTILVVLVFVSGGTVSGTVAFLVGALLLSQPVKRIGNIHIMFQQSVAGVERLTELLEEQPSVPEISNAPALPQFSKEIEFDRVSFAYDEQLVLKDISVKIPRGSKLGVAGESGSGKSTFINLLFRFYDPTSGEIRIDGTSLRDVSVLSLREQMALVSQEILVFDQTISENIACGRLGATMDEVEAAARAANAEKFIRALPAGYETLVGERGVKLSGGQRQRLAIARAFVRDAPVLVLDEATAALDSQSEAEVQAAIDSLAERRTVVSIAHRLSTLSCMDRIIVFSEGRIVEEGGFQELLKLGGIFANMAERQGIRPE